MVANLDSDFSEMERKLKLYVDKGRLPGSVKAHLKPMMHHKPDASLIKPLTKTSNPNGNFLAVDCSTRTLKRANNWGIYLMRVSCAAIKGRSVDWNYFERICTAVGDAHVRRSRLQDIRIELESQMALKILKQKATTSCCLSEDVHNLYLLLDGGGYFGGERKFRVSLYSYCERKGLNLLAISKNSPSLRDDKGRDLVATTYNMAPYDIWVYHPVRKADKDRSLYGDVAIIKLCAESNHVFRCDVMEYLTNKDVPALLSPLTSVSEDPRCIGYPISLWLAHEFSTPSDSMLLYYHDQIEETLGNAGLLDILRREESCSSFADQIHGVKHAFEWEWWDDQY